MLVKRTNSTVEAMARVCRIVLVCEGWEDSAFLEGFLGSAGIPDRNIDRKTNPKGKGSGFDHVRKIFAKEVEALNRFREGHGVLAIMDEDGKGVENRRAWVASHLHSLRLAGMDCTQGRCLVLTKRNIETWVYWLTGVRLSENWDVSESDDYKASQPATANRSLEKGDWRSAGKQLHSINHTNPLASMPPELLASLGQLRNFIQAVRR